jgi:hypothetical protein
MIDSSSRYASVPTGTITATVDDEPRSIRYLRRRFIPTQTQAVTLLRHIVRQGNRVDGLSAFYFTDPLQFWRICDANKVLRPDELVETIGRSLAIVLPLR